MRPLKKELSGMVPRVCVYPYASFPIQMNFFEKKMKKRWKLCHVSYIIILICPLIIILYVIFFVYISAMTWMPDVIAD